MALEHPAPSAGDIGDHPEHEPDIQSRIDAHLEQRAEEHHRNATAGHAMICETCGTWKRYEDGTLFNTPRERAQSAMGGHLSYYPDHEVYVAPVPKVEP